MAERDMRSEFAVQQVLRAAPRPKANPRCLGSVRFVDVLVALFLFAIFVAPAFLAGAGF